MPEKWLAIDVGGANLKLADGHGYAATEYFPLWREPQNLATRLIMCIAQAPPCQGVVATMTGELADCFPTKRAGVTAIVQALELAAGSRPLFIYRVTGEFVDPRAAVLDPLLAAASNWHALARYAARYLPCGNGLLVDIGSTTCDIIPIRQGLPAARGLTDPDRLATGELVYTGVVRSPICALVATLPWRGAPCGVAQELFATAADAYLLLGDLPEDNENCNTADGQPSTKFHAHDRLARAICADRELFNSADAMAAAQAVAQAQRQLVAAAMRRVVAHRDALAPQSGQPAVMLISGQGEFLARQAIGELDWSAPAISLGQKLGPDLSRAATAHALAVLMQEQAGTTPA